MSLMEQAQKKYCWMQAQLLARVCFCRSGRAPLEMSLRLGLLGLGVDATTGIEHVPVEELGRRGIPTGAGC